jgi:glutathione S-transferase
MGNACQSDSSDAKLQVSTYELKYFDARGVAEVIRFIFAVAEQNYVDTRFSISFGKPGDFSTIIRPEFDKAKASGELDLACGKAPVLYADGVPTMGQSKAIERYLAKRFGLMGSSDEEAGVIDALCENVRDIKDAYNAAKRKPEGEERDQAVKTFFDETLVKWCKDTEKSLPTARSDFLVGSLISLADLTWFNFVGVEDKPFFDNVEGARKGFADCPRIKKAMLACSANTALKQWIAKRPKTMF